jgi:hypothetical protein
LIHGKDEGNGKEWWLLCSGLVDDGEEKRACMKWEGVEWAGGTRDGGICVWLRKILDDGSENDGEGSGKEERLLRAWKGDDTDAEGVVDIDELLTPKEVSGANGDEKGEGVMRASCYCKGVQFYITRPNKDSAKAYSPYPDLMIPYNSGKSAANPSHNPWFICGNKYLAGTCTCTSCRHNLGFETQTWAFIPKCNIFSSHTNLPLTYDDLRSTSTQGGTLTRYESSEGVHREFCGKCGSTVFWHCDERPGVVDVSTGLLEGKEGVRCEEWLEWWTERVSFRELAGDGRLVDALEDGLRSWGKKTTAE